MARLNNLNQLQGRAAEAVVESLQAYDGLGVWPNGYAARRL